MNNLFKREQRSLASFVSRRKLRNSVLVHLNAGKEPCANSISSSGTRVARIFPQRLLPENRLEFFFNVCTDKCNFTFYWLTIYFLPLFRHTFVFSFFSLFVLSAELDLWNWHFLSFQVIHILEKGSTF